MAFVDDGSLKNSSFDEMLKSGRKRRQKHVHDAYRKLGLGLMRVFADPKALSVAIEATNRIGIIEKQATELENIEEEYSEAIEEDIERNRSCYEALLQRIKEDKKDESEWALMGQHPHDPSIAPKSPKYPDLANESANVGEGALLQQFINLQAQHKRRASHSVAVTNWIHDQNPSERFVRISEKYNKLIEECSKLQDYRTADKYGDEKYSIIKATDFADSPLPGMRVFNLCRAKLADQSTCGLAFPAKLWWQYIKGPTTDYSQVCLGTQRIACDEWGEKRCGVKSKWGWKCVCEWGYLVHEAYVHGSESEAGTWVAELTEKFGKDINSWPQIGCGAGFRPWANGPSLVMEVCTDPEKDEWEAFISERIPQVIDDCIKAANLADLEKAFGKLTPEKVYSCFPVLLPKTNHYVHNGFVLRGIAKYPVDEWMKKERPVMTAQMWVLLVRTIAEQDKVNLGAMFEKADHYVKNGVPAVGC